MAVARYEVRLTQGAEDDLEALFDYVAETRSPAEAVALLDKLLEKFGTLETFPDRGAIPKELEAIGISEFRQTLVPPYRLIYRVVARKVFIAVIADGRRDMQALLERRLLGR
jgi:toxin ParE1/3/4